MSLKTALFRMLFSAVVMSAGVAACDTSVDDSPFFGSASSSGTIPYDASPQVVPKCQGIQQGEACGYGSGVTECEVATFANLECNPVLHCGTTASWKAIPPLHDTCEVASCPAAYTTTNPNGCTTPGAGSLLCEYDEGTCGCAPAQPADAGIDDAGDAGDAKAGTAYEWRCVQADRDAGCPRKRPRLGAECVRPLVCDYGACLFEDGVAMDCYAGFWARQASSRSTGCH